MFGLARRRPAVPTARVGVLVTAVAVGVVGTLGGLGASPSQATTDGDIVQVTTHDLGGYRGECVDGKYRVKPVADGSGDGTWSGDWSYRAHLVYPGGKRDSLGSYSGGASSSVDTVTLCSGYDRFGAYKVEVTWAQYDTDHTQVAEGTTTSRFTFSRLERTAGRLTVTKKPYGTNGWKFSTRLTPAGKPIANARVKLWFKWRGTWQDYHVTHRTNARGVATWHTAKTLPPEANQATRYPFQFRYNGDTRTKPTRSKPFYLARRR